MYSDLKTKNDNNLFNALNIDQDILDIIDNDLKFKIMTPVQKATIPLFLSHKDVTVQAITGSGKTLSFIIPIIETIIKKKNKLNKYQVSSIIISPTRELALQIYNICNIFITKLKDKYNIRLFSLIGGNNVEYERSLWLEQGGNIIVATPGRLEYTLSASSNTNISKSFT